MTNSLDRVTPKPNPRPGQPGVSIFSMVQLTAATRPAVGEIVHLLLIDIEERGDPIDKILCLNAEADSFPLGARYLGTKLKDLVNCPTCLEYMHS